MFLLILEWLTWLLQYVEINFKYWENKAVNMLWLYFWYILCTCTIWYLYQIFFYLSRYPYYKIYVPVNKFPLRSHEMNLDRKELKVKTEWMSQMLEQFLKVHPGLNLHMVWKRIEKPTKEGQDGWWYLDGSSCSPGLPLPLSVILAILLFLSSSCHANSWALWGQSHLQFLTSCFFLEWNHIFSFSCGAS